MISKCKTIKQIKTGVDIYGACGPFRCARSSADKCFSLLVSSIMIMMTKWWIYLNFPISGQWLQVLSCFWELKLPGLHHGKVFRQWTWVRSPSTWLWWSPTVDNQHHVSATRCCQLQWVLVRKITSVRLLSSLTSMLTSSQVWWGWLWSRFHGIIDTIEKLWIEA